MNYILLLSLCCGASNFSPAGHWMLEKDGRDCCEGGFHTVNHGVVFAGPAPDGTMAARFNGVDSWLEVPKEGLNNLGKGDFTLSLWAYMQSSLDDATGDLVSRFDPDARRGFTFGIADYSGVSNSQPNHHNLFFGLDNGTEPVWNDCGHPGNAILIFGFSVHEGSLYAATCEPGESQAGHVYRYAGGSDWVDCGSPDKCNAVMALAVYDGHLYAGTGWYDTTGSALEASQNTTPGGRVYRYEGGSEWTFCGQLSNPVTGEAATMGGLAVFRGALHATTLKKEGFGLYRYEGGAEWRYCGNPGRRVLNPAVFNNDLYMVSYDAPGGPFLYNGQDWAYVGASIDPPIHQDYAFAVYGGRLHLSTWPLAHVYRMDDTGVWSVVGRPGEELETMGMMVYNGKLYTGTLPSSKVYRLDRDGAWTPVGGQLDTSEGKYRRAWSMALYQGRLFCGTLPAGRVYSLEAGASVTYDHALTPGWRHLAVTRRGGLLRLYVDGAPVASRGKEQDPAMQVSTSVPLAIGFGPGDYFNGWMRDVRVYEACLTDVEIGVLTGNKNAP